MRGAALLGLGCLVVLPPCAPAARRPLALVGSSGSAVHLSEGWPVDFTNPEGTTTLVVAKGESLLAVAERANLRAPSECRRGNCLSCVAKLRPDSSLNLATRVRGGTGSDEGDEEDGCTFLCGEAAREGYVLTCSAYVTGPGVKVELEQLDAAYRIQFHDRFQPIRQAGFAASAGVMREWAEDHVAEWMEMHDPGASAADGQGSEVA